MFAPALLWRGRPSGSLQDPALSRPAKRPPQSRKEPAAALGLLSLAASGSASPDIAEAEAAGAMAAEGDVELELEAEPNGSAGGGEGGGGRPAEKPRKHDSGAADLERVTDYAEEKEIQSSNLETVSACAGRVGPPRLPR